MLHRKRGHIRTTAHKYYHRHAGTAVTTTKLNIAWRGSVHLIQWAVRTRLPAWDSCCTSLRWLWHVIEDVVPGLASDDVVGHRVALVEQVLGPQLGPVAGGLILQRRVARRRVFVQQGAFCGPQRNRPGCADKGGAGAGVGRLWADPLFAALRPALSAPDAVSRQVLPWGRVACCRVETEIAAT